MTNTDRRKSITAKQPMCIRLDDTPIFQFNICMHVQLQDDGTIKEERWIEPVSTQVEKPVKSTGIGGNSTALRQALHPGNRKN